MLTLLTCLRSPHIYVGHTLDFVVFCELLMVFWSDFLLIDVKFYIIWSDCLIWNHCISFYLNTMIEILIYFFSLLKYEYGFLFFNLP